MPQGTIVALYIKPSQNTFEKAESLSIVAGKGIEGDHYFGHRTRQVLFLSTEELAKAGFESGDWREQVTVEFSGLQDLAPGTPVQVGDVSFEVEGDCAPCAHLAERLGENPVDFVHRTLRKRGMFLKPTGNGQLRVGDVVIVKAN